MLIVVSYDIADDRRRLRVANTLAGFGHRVQLSVFECHLDHRQLDQLRHRLSALIAADSDSLRVYRLCGECESKVEVYGLGKVTVDPDVYIL